MISRPAWDRPSDDGAEERADDRDPAEALVLRAHAGDDDAFEALVHTFHEPLLAVIRRRIRNPDDAEDVLQEAWARIARHLGDMREPSRFRAWAARIAQHCSIDFLRAHRAERLRLISTDAELIDSIQDSRQPPLDEALIASEASAQLRAALARLSAQDRALLELRDSAELPYAEVASRLGITVGTAQVRAHRARRRLQRMLALAIEEIGCAVSEEELEALVSGQTRAAQGEMLWRHIGTCGHCEYRLRLLKLTGARARSSGAA
jgi:RNA polymerase sigma-70 factor, ECF subfamily